MTAWTTLAEELAAFERLVLVRRLEAHSGNATAAAESLGISREGYWKKCRRLGIDLRAARAAIRKRRRHVAFHEEQA